ncbi:VWA domain-containing protein [Lamprobacter modestohalophilus]|uniref:VWA domain-containing protein n=1 Tax=Lamprobacter modestohalophilus TaxID=1064514 RepID=UPI002ADEB493|nr:VWA domain-containing protein [Lamprobacter modestohalophilus]MEA1048397.1 VWA domain-containing protein [Lamprobacter modestohalophilus]
MKNSAFTKALPIVAAAYGRRFGVQVKVGGDTACTNGRIIQIPTLVDEPIAKTLAWGYLAHESGHIKHTDFSVWPTASQHSALIRTVTNILEDVRIEKAMLRDYPGTRQTLDAVLEWMLAKGQISAPQASESPPTVFANSLLVLARYRYRQQPMLAEAARQAELVLRQVFPARFVHRLFRLMTAIPSLSSTAESLALAERIVALMTAEASSASEAASPTSPQTEPAAASSEPQTEPAEPGPEPSTEADKGNTAVDTEPGQADEPGATEPDGDTQAEMESDTADQAEGQGPGLGSVSDAGDEAETTLSPEISSDGADGALAQTLAADDDDFPEDVFTRLAEILQTHSEHSPTLMPTLEQGNGPQDQGQALLTQVRSQSTGLTTRLQALVESHTRARTRITRRGLHLSGRLLHRAGVGDARLFRHLDQRRAPNTALHLLVDLSSSMLYGQDRLALEAAMSLALALEPIRGVTRAVTAFPDRQGRDTQVTQLLAHGQRVAAHAGAFVREGRGSTPMTGALWFAAADLLARPEPRKVLLTLTDGEPDHMESTRKVIQQASGAGIEVIGVGIAYDVSGLFPLAIRIGTIAELKPALFSIAEQLLLSQH